MVREEPRPINGARAIVIGSKPIDGGYLIVNANERTDFLKQEPTATSWLRPYIGAVEYINGGCRYILALQCASPAELSAMPTVIERLTYVRDFRLGKRPAQRKLKDDGEPQARGISSAALAATPSAFHVTVLPERSFLVIPEVSSERREYIPIGWLEPPTIPSNKLRALLDATSFEFGILTSIMHMAWTKAVTGRLKSDIQYGIGIVYNTFPWPAASDAQRTKIAALAEAVLAARANHPTASLAILYDPLTMPADLRAAHTALDRAVDRLYRPEPFEAGLLGDRDRVEHLFGRYAALIDPLTTAGVKANRRVARRVARAGT